MKIKITGQPISKKRPRFSTAGRFVRAYSNQNAEKKAFQYQLKEQYAGEPLAGPLQVTLEFVMARPKAHWGTGRNKGKVKVSAPSCHIKKPDIDNLEKFALDCMNGIVFKDDSQICILKSIKRYQDAAGSPHTIIIIKRVYNDTKTISTR